MGEDSKQKKRSLSHIAKKGEREVKCDWDSLLLAQAGLPGANSVLKNTYINPDD